MDKLSELFPWIRTLRRRYRLVFGVALGTGVLTLAIGFLLPRWYTARASILPPHEETMRLPGGQIVGQTKLLENLLPYSQGITLVEVYLGILESDVVARTLIERFSLQERFGTPNSIKTMQALRARVKVSDTVHRIIEVRVEDRDPQLAADLANAYLEELDRQFRETRIASSTRRRLFLETRLSEVKASLDSLEALLVAAQDRSDLTVLSQGMDEAAEAAGDLLGRRMALQVRLEMLKQMGLEGTPTGEQTELELDAIQGEIAKLPELGLDVARRIRDVRINERLHEELWAQLEAAKLEEARDTPAIEVLDRAVPPDRHSRPRRGLMAIAGAIGGLVLSLGWAVHADPDR